MIDADENDNRDVAVVGAISLAFRKRIPSPPMIGPSPKPPDSAIPGPGQSQAESGGEVSGEHGAHPNEQKENKLLGDGPQPTGPNTALYRNSTQFRLARTGNLSSGFP